MLKRALHPLYRRLETEVHPLRYLFLEITQRCNLECRHCGTDCGRKPRPGELSTGEWLAVCDQLARDFDPRHLVVVITGGEPLCCPGLDRLLERLHGHGFSWGLVTNGWLLHARNIERLLKWGLASATISLDGLREQHDWLRGRAGSFDRATAGIRLLAEANPRFFDVVTCVHPGNLGTLPEIHRLLASLGVPAWRLFPIFAKGRAQRNQELLLSPAEFRRMLGFIEQARASSSGSQSGVASVSVSVSVSASVSAAASAATSCPAGALSDKGPSSTARPNLSIDLSCEGYLPPCWDRAVRSEPYFCRAGICVASVLCDGSIGACPNISRSLVQGNIREVSLKQAWDERFVVYRDRSWLRVGKCRKCDHFSRCLGNSLHLWDDVSQECGLCTLDLLESTSTSASASASD
ncbi:MAG: radical SAM protein [Pseudomonadota bacterium]